VWVELCRFDRGQSGAVSALIAVYTTRAGQTSTHFAVCLAWTLAERSRVLLVDCDMEGGTIADLLLLRTEERGIANCFGDRPASADQLAAQAVAHPARGGLSVVPGLSRSYGYEVSECLGKLAPALRGASEDVVIADLGHPLSHPGLRSPKSAAEAICSIFGRAFIVIRDDPALLSRSIAVLQAARPPHGELIICHQHGRAYRRAVLASLQQNLPGMALRDVWQWDEARAARMAETGVPASLVGVDVDLNIVPVTV
jgi:MinD-like ATPase involved in chromosome partitioning or flagellar assembly